ncbi:MULTISPECIES: YdgH/BhsA/McbA-like domain containing protein [unclassified Brenneria]|uniref:multiple stress resistance protein BhsA n=1 Tax=unclassified Brenneria TaxID=2634434 RepID=UPI0029C3F8A2|nr:MULTISPECIES: YdgH/BhsA/McbA-like domain containing protein [unclassified Brenneria]MDX5629346.1 YdgH/BhsA/McbA-like domain containing protein [Brenneria sp. L3-3Z]MDX5696491.1 YdgH/BhsA/McbA-like domain containing protein [Brenneria sp. L4-2C]MEE3663058.1 YdgH/BhsA/McbA-like domain containing protein [Brenneria sp. g21c3]
MKNVKTIAAAVVLATLSFGASAADYVSAQQAQGLEKVGVVTATALDLDSLKTQLAEKADKAGAKAFTITSASGGDQLRGSAVIYN